MRNNPEPGSKKDLEQIAAQAKAFKAAHPGMSALVAMGVVKLSPRRGLGGKIYVWQRWRWQNPITWTLLLSVAAIHIAKYLFYDFWVKSYTLFLEH